MVQPGNVSPVAGIVSLSNAEQIGSIPTAFLRTKGVITQRIFMLFQP
jgi:hypothetical protein